MATLTNLQPSLLTMPKDAALQLILNLRYNRLHNPGSWKKKKGLSEKEKLRRAWEKRLGKLSKENRIKFKDVVLPYVKTPNAETLAAIQEARDGKVTHYKNTDEMFKKL